MALDGFGLPQIGKLPLYGNITSHDLDANNDGFGFVFKAPKSGDISKVLFAVNAVDGTPPTYRVGLEGVSSRAPDGTYLTSGTAYVDQSSWSTGTAWQTLGAAATVSAGDLVAATIRYQTGTVDASNNVQVSGQTQIGLAQSGNPYTCVLTAGSWAVGNTAMVALASVQYSDGTILSCNPAATVSNNSWSSASSPRYRGNKFTPPVDARIFGAWFQMRAGDTSDWSIELYEGTDSSPIVSAAVDWSECVAGTGQIYTVFVPFEPTALTGGTAYRIIANPTTTNANTYFGQLSFVDSDSAAAYAGMLSGSTASTAGSWTDDATVVYSIVPAMDQVESGGASTTIVLCGE